MTIEIEDVDSCTKKIKLTIPYGEYQQQVDAQLKRVGQNVQIKGFRKGKVPNHILEKKFGPEVKREVLTQFISDRITHAIQEKGIHAVSPPNLLDVQAEEGSDISVSAQVEVVPELTLKDCSGLELEMQIYKVAEKEVDDVVEFYRERQAKTQPVTDRGVRDRDIIKIDFEGKLDGKEFAGGSGKDYVFQVGQKGTIAGFEEGVLEMEVGGEKDIQVTFSDNHAQKDLAGRTADFHITLREINYRVLPELNDDFARSADPNKKFETLLNMKVKLREELETYEKKEAKKRLVADLAEQLREMNPINPPESLVREQVRFMVAEEQKKANPAAAGKSPDPTPGEDTPIQPEDDKKYRPGAVKLIQQELVIGKFAEDLKIEVGQEEFKNEIDNLSKMMGGGNTEAMQKEWQKSGILERIGSRMKREKTLETLLAKLKVKEEMVDRPTLIPDN